MFLLISHCDTLWYSMNEALFVWIMATKGE
jgi:hypothetical protein